MKARTQTLRWRMLSVLLPVAFLVLIIALLQTKAIHQIFGFTTAQLPLPTQICTQFARNLDKIVENGWTTVSVALFGLILGSFLGFLSAAIASVKPRIFQGMLPLLVAINSISVVAMAPIMNRWFESSFCAKAAVVTIACIGAMSVNAYKGMNDLPVFSRDLMYSYAASDSVQFFFLQLPNCLPRLFVGLRTNVVTAMISAIISEFFSTESQGLGYMIKTSLKIGNQKVLGWAYIIAAAAVSIFIYFVITLIERRALKERSR